MLGVGSPVPRIFKGSNLRLTIFARFIPKKHVVISVAIERWIEVYKVYALIGDVLA
jgi:hypothetical protein